MKNTEKVLNEIKEVLNTSPEAKSMMNMLQKEAVKNNWTDEQWEEVKTRIMTTLFYKMAMEIPEIRYGLAEDLYEMSK